MYFEIKTDIILLHWKRNCNPTVKIQCYINEDTFCGKIHCNKDLNHMAIFKKVIRQRQKKMRNINCWLTMSNDLGLCIIKTSLLLFISLKNSVQKYMTLRSCHASHHISNWNDTLLKGAWSQDWTDKYFR